MNRDPVNQALAALQRGVEPESVSAARELPAQPGTKTTGPLRLRVSHQGKVIHERVLSDTPIVLGRDSKTDLPLVHDKVSRRHATIKLGKEGEYLIADCGSRHGTTVNGTAIKHETALHPGDVIEIGPFVLEVFGEAVIAESKVEVVEGTSDAISTLNAPGHLSAEHIAVLANLGDQLLTMASADARRITLCRQMVQKAFRGLSATILRLDRGCKVPQPVLLCPAESSASWRGRPLYFSRRVASTLLANPQPILATNVSNNPQAIELSLNVDTLPLAVVACPLHVDAHHVDVLYVVLPPECASLEWLALGALAAQHYMQTEAAWRLRTLSEAQAVMEGELLQARQLQLRLVPMPSSLPGMDYALGFQPCRAVGGDYVDVLPQADGRVLLVIADVCGKGLPAALVAFALHTLVRSGVRQGLGLQEVGVELNSHLCETLPDGRFVTLLAVLLDPRTGQMEYLNAGHPPALAMDAAGNHRELCVESSVPLGIAPERPLVGGETLGPGELLLLYTDGLTELPLENTKLLGLAGLTRIVRKIHDLHQGMSSFGNHLTQAMNHIQGENNQADDRTFLCIRRAV